MILPFCLRALNLVAAADSPEHALDVDLEDAIHLFRQNVRDPADWAMPALLTITSKPPSSLSAWSMAA